MNITLTNDQEAALSAFQRFLVSGTENAFVLSGYAGTGKSTLIRVLLDRLPKFMKAVKLVSPKAPDYTVQLTATTNKAADSFRDITGMDVRTIQSHLNLIVQTDYQTQKTRLVRKRHKEIHNELLFIDEASYVDHELLRIIEETTKDCKVVFIGDPAQLTPVKSNSTPVFAKKYPKAHLSNVVRQAEGNPIIELATKFRNTVNTGEFFSFTPDGHHIQYLEREAFHEAIKQEFTRPDWSSQDSKVLAWTNKRVIEYNHAIGQVRDQRVEFQVGDYAVCNSFFSKDKCSFKTDEAVHLTWISEPRTEHGVVGKHYQLSGLVQAFCPDRLEDRKALEKKAKAENNYSLLEYIDTNWVDLRAMYACTINKSQGSTYDRVFIDLDDIKRCNSGNQIARMLYVAVSRARHQVFFTGDLV